MEEVKKEDLKWMQFMAVVMTVGLGALLFFSLVYKSGPDAAHSLSSSFLLAGACSVVGGFVGFLFGIPRRTKPVAGENGADAKPEQGSNGTGKYQANTNLEEISDWLTKIIVGVSLTQIEQIRKFVGDLSTKLAPAVGSEQVALLAIVFFATCGFIFGYLWTRLVLAGAFSRAELGEVRQQIGALQEAQKKASADAEALAYVYNHLDKDSDTAGYDFADLAVKIKGSSEQVRVQILFLAYKARSENWRTNQEFMERTIPLFRALIAADPSKHSPYGELGFALKDSRTPRWGEAEEMLTKAIDLRGPAAQRGRRAYEFNRAICRIRLDPAQTGPSTGEWRDKIVGDLKVAAGRWGRLYATEEPVKGWLQRNNIDPASLSTAV